MKKLLSVLLTIGLIGSLTACANDSSKSASTATTQEAATTEAATDGTQTAEKTETAKTEVTSTAAKTVSVAVETGSKPLSFEDENGELTGYEVEVIKALDEIVAEYDFQIESVDADAAQVGLEAGKYAFIGGGAYKTAEREEKYLIPDEFNGVSLVYIYVKEGNDSIKTLADLVGKKVVPSSPNGGIFNLLTSYNEEHPDAQITIETADGVALADRFKSVDSGEYDALVLPNNLGFNEIKEELGIKVVPVETPVAVNPTYFLLSKDQTDLKEKIDAGLKTLRENGTLSELSTKWYGEDTIKFYQQ